MLDQILLNELVFYRENGTKIIKIKDLYQNYVRSGGKETEDNFFKYNSLPLLFKWSKDGSFIIPRESFFDKKLRDILVDLIKSDKDMYARELYLKYKENGGKKNIIQFGKSMSEFRDYIYKVRTNLGILYCSVENGKRTKKHSVGIGPDIVATINAYLENTLPSIINSAVEKKLRELLGKI